MIALLLNWTSNSLPVYLVGDPAITDRHDVATRVRVWETPEEMVRSCAEFGDDSDEKAAIAAYVINHGLPDNEETDGVLRSLFNNLDVDEYVGEWTFATIKRAVTSETPESFAGLLLRWYFLCAGNGLWDTSAMNMVIDDTEWMLCKESATVLTAGIARQEMMGWLRIISASPPPFRGKWGNISEDSVTNFINKCKVEALQEVVSANQEQRQPHPKALMTIALADEVGNSRMLTDEATLAYLDEVDVAFDGLLARMAHGDMEASGEFDALNREKARRARLYTDKGVEMYLNLVDIAIGSLDLGADGDEEAVRKAALSLKWAKKVGQFMERVYDKYPYSLTGWPNLVKSG
jgi:hypothetical protein